MCIFAVIVLNVVALMLPYWGMSAAYERGLYYGNIVFTAIFTLECVMKVLGLSPRGYFTDSWNLFDFVIVVGSVIDVALDGQSVNVNFLRIFRAARLIKLLKKVRWFTPFVAMCSFMDRCAPAAITADFSCQ